MQQRVYVLVLCKTQDKLFWVENCLLIQHFFLCVLFPLTVPMEQHKLFIQIGRISKSRWSFPSSRVWGIAQSFPTFLFLSLALKIEKEKGKLMRPIYFDINSSFLFSFRGKYTKLWNRVRNAHVTKKHWINTIIRCDNNKSFGVSIWIFLGDNIKTFFELVWRVFFRKN